MEEDDDWRSLLESSWKSADKKPKVSSPTKATDGAATMVADVKASDSSASSAGKSSSSGLGKWTSLIKTPSQAEIDSSQTSVATPVASAGHSSVGQDEDDEEDWRSLLNSSWSKATKPVRSPAPSAPQPPAVQKSTSRSSFGSWTRLLSQPSLDTPDEGCDASPTAAENTGTEAPANGDAAKDASAAKASVEDEGEEEDLASFLSAAFTKAKTNPKVVVEEVIVKEVTVKETVKEAPVKEEPVKEPVKEPSVEDTVEEVAAKEDSIDEVTIQEVSLEEGSTSTPAAAEEPMDVEAEQEESSGAAAVDVEMQMEAAALLEEMEATEGEESAEVEVVDMEVVASEVQEVAVEAGEDDVEEPQSADRAATWQQGLEDLEDESEAKDGVVDLEEDDVEVAAEGEAATPEAGVRIMTLKGKASGAPPAAKKNALAKSKAGGAAPADKKNALPKSNSVGDKKNALPKNNSGEHAVKCEGGHPLKEFKVSKAGTLCDICSSTIQIGISAHGCRRCNYDLCTSCFGKAKGGQGKGAQKGWANQAKHGDSWGPKPPAAPPSQGTVNAWNSKGTQQSHGKVNNNVPKPGPIIQPSVQRSNSAPAKLPQSGQSGKITPIKPLERGNSGELQRTNSGKITPIKPVGSNNSDLNKQNSGNLGGQPGLKRQRTDTAPIAARDAEGRQYDLQRIVLNFANVGATYATKVLKRSQDEPKWLFDWEGVRRAVQYFTKKHNFKVVGVIYENFWATDKDSKQKVELPQDIRKMCESVEETPRIVGQCHSSADDEMTIKCAYHRNCRFMDNDNYRDWKQQLRDERCRKWLDNCQDLLHMRYYFDSGVGCFETLDGNIPAGMLAPLDDRGSKIKISKQELWTAPNK